MSTLWEKLEQPHSTHGRARAKLADLEKKRGFKVEAVERGQPRLVITDGSERMMWRHVEGLWFERCEEVL